MKATITKTLLLLIPAVSLAQVPVDDAGNVIGDYESSADIMPIGEEGIPRLTQTELQELVGPIALYPDELLAVVLPAAAYPLQIVEAARFLEALEDDPTLTPNPDWDDSIIALINYPEVVELLNEDLDWTWRLGEAVVAQQADVVAAVESFRDRAYAAGNLKSDEYQTVSQNDGTIYIEPAEEDVIYVPYYEPTRVVHYQPRPVYYYYPRPYPVYYYPYSAHHHFGHNHFWGVTTAFSIGWLSDSLHVYHHSYRGHPYYGRSYWDNWYYRRPSITVYNTTYVRNTNLRPDRYRHGDRWQPRRDRRSLVLNEGYARHSNRTSSRNTQRDVSRSTVTRTRDSDRQENNRAGRQVSVRENRSEPIRFRERDTNSRSRTATVQRPTNSQATQRKSTKQVTTRTVEARQRTSAGTAQTTRRNERPAATTQRATRTPATQTRATPQRATRTPAAQTRATSQRATRTPAAQTRATSERAARAQPARSTQRASRPAPAPRAAPQRSAPQRAAPARTQRAPAQQSSRRSESRSQERKSSERSSGRSRKQH